MSVNSQSDYTRNYIQGLFRVLGQGLGFRACGDIHRFGFACWGWRGIGVYNPYKTPYKKQTKKKKNYSLLARISLG